MKCNNIGCSLPATTKGFYVHRRSDLSPHISWLRLCKYCGGANEPFWFKTKQEAILYAVSECLRVDLNAK